MAGVLIVEDDGAVSTVLAAQAAHDVNDLTTLRQRQDSLIKRLMAEGPDAMAIHIARRLSLDRKMRRAVMPSEALTWTEIADWGRQEGLLDAGQARILRLRESAEPWI